MTIPRPARYLHTKIRTSGETEVGSAGEQPAKGYPVRLIADDEARRAPSVASFDRGSGADQREAVLTLGFRWFAFDFAFAFAFAFDFPPIGPIDRPCLRKLIPKAAA